MKIECNELQRDSYDFVSEWMKHADIVTDDPFFRFVCYYIAFNHLYNSRELWDEERKNTIRERERKTNRRAYERDCICAFLRKWARKLSFSVSNEEFSLLGGVRRDAPDLENDADEKKRVMRCLGAYGYGLDDEEKKVTFVLIKIYHARCNLFHGEKHVTSARDKRIAECSAEVLKRLLEEVVHQKIYSIEHLVRD